MESPHIVNDGFDPTAIRVLRAWMDDIDPEALAFARKRFAESHPQAESDGWSDERFLDETGLKKDGVLTHAAMILLGKEESRHKMRFEPWMRWILRDGDNAVLDSELFYPPFLLSVERMCGMVRNLTQSAYDPWLLHEALYNCICHQNYLRNEFITLTESEDCLVFDNCGDFLPGDTSAALDGPPVSLCRNRTLAEAMRRMGFIDLKGEGMRRMCRCQADRMSPLPDFDVSEGRVTVTVSPKIAEL